MDLAFVRLVMLSSIWSRNVVRNGDWIIIPDWKVIDIGVDKRCKMFECGGRTQHAGAGRGSIFANMRYVWHLCVFLLVVHFAL